MANTNAPFGLAQSSQLSSAPNYAHRTIKNGIASANTTKIYTGDPVKLLSTGYLAQWTAGTAVSQLAGIFVGCEYLSTALGKRTFSPYWPGADTSADADAFIIPLTGGTPQVLLVQTDSTGVALADRGSNFDVALGTGSTLTGRSGCYLDVSTSNTTATLPFRLLNLYSDVGVGSGSESGAYNWAVVIANVAGAGATGI